MFRATKDGRGKFSCILRDNRIGWGQGQGHQTWGDAAHNVYVGRRCRKGKVTSLLASKLFHMTQRFGNLTNLFNRSLVSRVNRPQSKAKGVCFPLPSAPTDLKHSLKLAVYWRSICTSRGAELKVHDLKMAR